MSDITMCHGGDCPMRNECHRHRAVPCEYRQSYFAVVPFDNERFVTGSGLARRVEYKISCRYFSPITVGDKVHQLLVIETILPDDTPVYPDYVYIADNVLVRFTGWEASTVGQWKARANYKEIRRCRSNQFVCASENRQLPVFSF